MRDRLLLAFVSLVLAVVTAFMVVRGNAVSEMVHAEQQRDVRRSAATIAGLLAGTDVTQDRLEGVVHAGERVVFVDALGRTVRAEDPATAGRPRSAEDLSATSPVAGGGTVTVSLAAQVVDSRVAAALLPLVIVSLGLTVVAAAAAVLLARRLSRPFRELAEVAERIGRGDFHVPVHRYTIPEADTVARVLRASARDLDGLVRRDRDFAAHASHDLRTPITATRLELEDLAASPHTPPEVVGRLSEALGQLDRLSATVAGMLEASHESRVGAGGDIDLAALVRDAAGRWRGRTRDRRIVDTCKGVVAVRLPAGSLMRVMDVLLGNAVSHGEGTVTVSVTEAAAYAEVRVADEGPHGRAVAGARGAPDGRAGLARATEIVEAFGGQLRLTDEPCTTFSLVVPRSRRETVDA